MKLNKFEFLSKTGENMLSRNNEKYPNEGNLRATGEYKTEKTLQVPEVQELVTSLSNITERAGFEPAVGQALHSLSKAAP